MSDVLFWQQKSKSDDPFVEPTLPAAFYHPSLPKALTIEESQIKLGPEKLHYEEDKENIDKEQLTPQEKAFMQRTNTLIAKELPTRDTPSPRDTSSKFDESWPTSERPSTIESPPESRSLRDGENVGNVSRTSSSASARSKDGSKTQMQDFSISALLRMDSSTSGSSSHQRLQSSHTSSHHGSNMKTAPSSLQHDSVLARYIHRFRHGEPQSREERTAKGESVATKELWWFSPPTRDVSATSSFGTHSNMSSSSVAKFSKGPQAARRGFSNSSSASFLSQTKRPSIIGRGSNIPTRDRRQGTKLYGDITKGRGLSPTRPDDIPSSSTPVMDAETLLLQEKAQHLLEISESSLSSEPIVSSEGIGSSPSLPSAEEKVYIPPADISPIREKEPIGGLTRRLSQTHVRPQTNLRPEDDILYQWRLRRKIELAKQGGEIKRGGSPNVLLGRERSDHYFKPSIQQHDSSLEALRSRLQRGHLTNHSSHIPLREDRQMLSPTVRTRGTDPIPQAASTQTTPGEDRGLSWAPKSTLESSKERGLQSKLGNQDVDSEIPQGESCHGYNLPSNRTEKQSTTVAGSPPRVKMKGQPIASPDKEGAIKEEYTILPHWHMSCDIIPCPQGNIPHSHSEDELVKRKLEWRRDEPKYSTKERHWSGERQEEAADEGWRLLNDNEKGTVEDDDRRSEGPELREIKKDERMQRKSKKTDDIIEELEQKQGQRKGQSQRGSGFTQRSGIPRLTQRVGGLRTNRASVKRISKQAASAYQPERKNKGTSEDGTLDHSNDKKEKTSPRSSDTEPFTDISADEDRVMEEVECSKQESTTEVQSAIGQVITKRLFDPDSPKVSKTASSAGSKFATQGSQPEAADRQEESTSDSDEFSDDSLLQMLRQKRALYEKQLQQIDNAITSKLQER